jgi:hypothetical protein
MEPVQFLFAAVSLALVVFVIWAMSREPSLIMDFLEVEQIVPLLDDKSIKWVMLDLNPSYLGYQEGFKAPVERALAKRIIVDGDKSAKYWVQRVGSVLTISAPNEGKKDEGHH